MDQRQQQRVSLSARFQLTTCPIVIAAARDGQRLTELADGMFVLHGVNPLEPFSGASERMPNIFLKYPAAY